MEEVIPSRDLNQPTHKSTWNRNSDVAKMNRVNGSRGSLSQRQRSHTGRTTLHWPFQSIVTETDLPSPTVGSFRRATWQIRRALGRETDSVDGSIVPDYVVNYIRGETPETLAQKKKHGGRIGERDIDIRHQHRPDRSRAGELEGFDEEDSGRSRATTPHDEEQHILWRSSEKRRRSWGRLTRGWRAGVILNMLLSFLVLVAGVTCFALSVSKVPILAGEFTVFKGSCTAVSNINFGLRAVVSIFTMVSIAGASYLFQVLSSPTRMEVSFAHHHKKWLDIGVPSVRNLRHISKGRVVLGMLILVAAEATQVIFNAILFTSESGTGFNLIFVTPPFIDGAPFSNATPTNGGGLTRIDILAIQDLASRDRLTHLTSDDCISQFDTVYNTDFRAALLVTDADSPSSSLLQTTIAGTSITEYTTPQTDGSPKGWPGVSLDGAAVHTCLAQRIDPSTQTCTLFLNGSLLGLTAIINLITLLSAAAILSLRSFEPLATLGDAVASFLRDPDPDTRDSCLMTKQDVRQDRWCYGEAKYWEPRRHYWLRTPSLLRWLLSCVPWLAAAGLVSAALAVTIRADPRGRVSPFGKADPHAVYFLESVHASAVAIIVSLPQLLVGALYFAINSLLTTFYLSHESSLYGTGQRRPLRVSADPEGSQTTGLYLTLPRPISWLLFWLFSSMAFALSQSIFVVVLERSASSATPVGVGLSCVGLLAVLGLLAALALLVIGLGFRQAPGAVMANGRAQGNPLVLAGGSCSAVIAARCHAHLAEEDLWKRSLTWGVVQEGHGMEQGHCAYSARAAGPLDVGRSYA